MRSRHPSPATSCNGATLKAVAPFPAIAGMCSHYKPKSATRILSADFLKNSLSAPSAVFKFPFLRYLAFWAVLGLSARLRVFPSLLRFKRCSGPFCAFLARSGRMQHTGKKKAAFCASSKKKTQSGKVAALGRPVPPAPFLPCFLLSGQEKHFLCRPGVNVLPSFLSVLSGSFCPFAWKWPFLRHPESLALESRPPFCTF